MKRTEGSFKIYGRKMAYIRWKSGRRKPVVLCVHGWLDNAASFEAIAPVLVGHFEIIAIDLAGHGHSDPREGSLGYSMTDWVPELLQAVKILKPDYLMGHSMGAAICLLFASIFPEGLKGLVLLDAIGPRLGVARDARLRIHEYVNALEKSSGRRPFYKNVDDAIAARMASMLRMTLKSATDICKRGTKRISGGVTFRTDPRLLLPTPRRFLMEEVLPIVSALKVPTLWVVSGFWDGDYSLQSVKLFSKIRARKKRVKIPHSLHHLHIDFPQEVAGEVLAMFGDK